MSTPFGWIRVWIPAPLQRLGAWSIRADEACGGPEQPLPATGSPQAVRIEGHGLAAAGQFSFVLELSVVVTPAGITEIHLPAYLLPTATASTSTAPPDHT